MQAQGAATNAKAQKRRKLHEQSLLASEDLIKFGTVIASGGCGCDLVASAVLLDEASQLVEPAAIIPMFFGICGYVGLYEHYGLFVVHSPLRTNL